ncbi:hypothetical protein [Actinopolyspora mortivallis]|uniref:Uncharacterized protein n=1 Tax=Actinopolyspora mortivallis TaxID=33906 RepID=A0A2T0H1J8_ACTMO|nr:hypothetical protein [Actinopolyspora mortivallis]PRW65241.1 hypothetical protein CEP50_01585 [Actinopolyspora mortivallis]
MIGFPDFSDTDRSGPPAPGSRAEFLAALQDMVTDRAPRVFALCEEIGQCQQAVLHYWGLAHPDRADLLGTGGSIHLGFRDAATAHHRLSTRTHPLHLVWA